MFLWIKLLHIAAVILFLGNITTGLFWHRHAMKQQDPKLLAHVVHGIIQSDRWFTVPMVIAIIVSGVICAKLAGYSILGTVWIAWSIGLFTLSGVLFIWQVAPLQKQMWLYSQSPQFEMSAYLRLSLRWELWGFAALLTPLASLALMVLKPVW